MIVKCEICSSEFKVNASVVRIGKGRFCSKPSFNSYRVNKPTSKNCFYRKCEGCDSQVYVTPSYNRRFCGRVCWAKNRNYKPTKETLIKLRQSHLGKVSNKKNGKIMACPICGKERYVNLSALGNRTVSYCGHICAFKGKKEHPCKGKKMKRGRRKEFPKTDESKLIRKSVEYFEWREDVFKRDQYTCQKCETKGGYLHPHHILNFSSHTAERFNVNNGTTLCLIHHREFHKLYGKTNNNKDQINDFLIKKNIGI